MTALDSELSVRGRVSGTTSARDVLGAYVGLTKPRVIELLLLTTVPVMFFAQRGVPPFWLVVATVVGGTLSAGSANALNCVYDRDIDEQMRRTRRRALPRHIVTPGSALVFGLALGVVSTLVLGFFVNWLSSGLALAASAFYLFGYTMVLKRRTTQNIVWGGLAGCFPTLIGWTAVTNELAWPPVVLFLVVFFWTPPHTWALAMRYREDYARVAVPMLPVVKDAEGVARQIVGYSWVMVADVPGAVAGGGHRPPLPGRGDAAGCRVPGRGTPAVAARTAQQRAHRGAADAAVPLVEHVPVAALRRRRARPAAHALTLVTGPPGGCVAGGRRGSPPLSDRAAGR